MRIHTLAGDTIELQFHWTPETMHLGRQAARRYVERMGEVVAMRRDPAKADGWAAFAGSRLSPDGRTRTDTYSIVPPLTDDERSIPEGELFVRDTADPMVNLHGDLPAPFFVVCSNLAAAADMDDAQDRGRAVVARFQAAISAALGNHQSE